MVGVGLGSEGGGGSDGEDGDASSSGVLFQLSHIEEEGAFGFDGEGVDAGCGTGFEGAGADARDIEAHVVVVAGDLDGEGSAVWAGQFAASGQAAVGAFEAFDGEDGALFDDDGLADFEAGDFLGDAEAEAGIVGLFGLEGWARGVAGAGHAGFEPGGGLDELDAGLGEFVGDGAEDGVGVFLFEAEEEFDGAEVGADGEEVAGGDLADHDAAGDAAVGEGAEEAVELADPEPDDLVDEGGKGGVGFAFEGDGDQVLEAGASRLPGQDQGEGAVAGDKT